MKRKHIFNLELIVLLVLIGFGSLSAQQQVNDSSNNYLYLNNQYTEYFEDIVSTYGQDSLDKYGFKGYYRWNNFWSTRYGEGGEMQPILDATNLYFNLTRSSVNPEPWEILGPIGLPYKHDTTYSGDVGKGMVISLWINPENHKEIFAGTHTAGLFYSNDGGNVWTALTDGYPEINGIYQILQHPDNENTFYILSANVLSGSSYGVFKSTDRGSTWAEFPITVGSTDIYPTSSSRRFPKKLIFNPDSSNVMMLITQSSILKSTDNGISWTEKYNGNFNSWGIPASDISSLCSGDMDCILSLRQQEHGLNNIFYDQTNPQNLYVSGHILLKSTDYGDTWDSITEQVTGRIREWDILTSTDENYPGYFWTYYSKMKSTGTTADSSGLAKYNMSTGEVDLYFFNNQLVRNFLRISPTDSNFIYLGGQGGRTLYRYNHSSNSLNSMFSHTFTSNNFIHYDCRDLVAVENTQGFDSLFIANDGGVRAGKEITYGSNSWTYSDLSTLNADWHNHLNITEFYAIDGDESEGEFLIGNTQDLNGFYLDSTGWYHTGFGDGGGIEVDKGDSNFVYYVDYQGGLRQSKNKGKTFQGWSSNIGALDASPRIPLTLDPENSNHLYVGTRGLRIYNNCYSSSSFITVDFPHDNGQIVTAIEFSESDPNILYVGTKKQYNSWDGAEWTNTNLYTGCLWKSPDKGSTWIDISKNFGGACQGFITGICVNPFNSNEIWVTLAGATTYANNQFLSKKIYHSLDGGASYQTYVEGIPDKIPVNKIKYDKTNHHLYIVTDIGVLTRDLLYGEGWEDFNDGLPLKMVNDIYLNQTDQKIIAATYGRSMWKTDLKPAEPCPEYSSVPTHINSNTIWDTPRRINNDIIIDSSYSLTIKSVSFFNAQSRLIVKRGAELVIDGGTLTNSCDSTNWQGIEVWGASTGEQNPAEQGLVSITDGTIENAIKGVVANNYYTLNAWQQGYRGGIIQAKYATFRNCNIAIQFDAYEPFSASYFTNCSFITDENYWLIGEPLAANPFAFVKLTSHRGVQFTNCLFQNEAPELFETQSRGTGILSTNGGFSVTDGSSFTDLYYGIYGMDVLAQNTFYVHDANFNSYRGIYMGSCYNNQIDGSNFVVPVSITGDNMQAYGLYMEYSTGYAIEDNTFISEESSPTGIGIYVNNSGTDDNEIYRNEFSNLQYSIVAQDINRKNTIGGLVIKCNYFDNTTSDVVVVAGKGSETIDHGIAKNQGALSTDPTQMAGNLFYYNTTSIDFDDLNNGLNHFNYFYPTNTAFGENVEPMDFTHNTVTKYGVPFYPAWSYTNGCPPHESGGGTLLTKMAVADEKADSTASVLNLLVDGGDTPELTSEVDQSTPAQTVDLYNELMATSPYLSDSVVESAIVKEDVLPNALLRDIMVANAHSSKSDLLMNALDTRWDPMPDYMKAQILQGRSLVSLKEETESRLGAFRLDKARALYGLSRMFMYDTLNPTTAIDSLIDLLSTEYTLSAQYQLAMLELGKGEYTLGNSVLSNIPTHIALTSQELTKHQQMVDYYNWLTSVKQSQGNISNPSASQRQQLWNMAMADSSKAGVYARNLLVALGDTTYHEPIILPDLYKSAQAQASYEELLNVQGPSLLHVFPNPASGYVILEYKLETDVPATISIHDMKGMRIKSMNTSGQQNQLTVITRDWLPGVYLAGLHINGKLIESTKFTVVK